MQAGHDIQAQDHEQHLPGNNMLLTDVTYKQPDLCKSILNESLSPIVFHKVNGGVHRLIKWLKDDKIILLIYVHRHSLYGIQSGSDFR
jgi:hypothetical protein